MTKTYRYSLGIDLGIVSIGTGLIQLDKSDKAQGILDAGVRIFDEFLGAADRRKHRQERKTLYRRKQRVQKLQKILQEHGLLPIEENALKKLRFRSPYHLRAEGVNEKFSSIHKLGRALWHIAKVRGAGFLTQLEESAEEDKDFSDDENSILEAEKATPKKGKKNKTENMYRKLEQELRESGKSLSEFFYERLKDGKAVRRRKNAVAEGIEYAVPRFLVKEEFHRLWDMQAKHFPQLTEKLKEKAYNIIFEDREHAPYANAYCSLKPESKEYRLPKMHRLAEQRRIYEQVNHLRFRTQENQHSLTREMRDGLVEKLFAGEELNKTLIKQYIVSLWNGGKVLSVNMPEIEGEGKALAKIKPFAHVKAFENIPHWRTLSETEQDEIIDFIAEPRSEPEKGNDSRLMSEEKMYARLGKMLYITSDNAQEILSRCVFALPKDRTKVGKSASMAIIEKLKEGKICVENGEPVSHEKSKRLLLSLATPDNAKELWHPLSHREAADACGFEAEAESRRAQAGSFKVLPYYGSVLTHDSVPVHPWHKNRATQDEREFGRVPNPVVHVVLNQLRKVVNEIIALYGKPERIVVELSREFGTSKKKRDEKVRWQKMRESDNEKIDEALLTLKLPRTRKNRIKYRLWKEQGERDIYTLDPIRVTEFAGYEIDHIVPRSKGGSDTYMNLALTSDANNKEKGDQYAYHFLVNKNKDKWQHILTEISKETYPKGKSWRFLPDAQAYFEKHGDADATDNRATDTSYMSKMAKKYLSCICKTVVPIRGGMTWKLREAWHLDGLEYDLMNIQISEHAPHDPVTGEIPIDPQTGYPERNPEWKAKPRIDQRHHALDALVLACTDWAMMKKMAVSSKRGRTSADFDAPFKRLAIDIEPVALSQDDDTNQETREKILQDFRAYMLDALKKVKVSPKAEHGLAGQLCEATKYRVHSAKGDGEYVTCYNRPLSGLETKRKVENITFKLSTLPQDKEIQDVWRENQRTQHAIQAEYANAEHILREKQVQSVQDGKKTREINEKSIVQEAIRLARQKDASILSSYKFFGNQSLVGVNIEKKYGMAGGNNHRVDFYEDAKGKVGWECISRFDVNQKYFKPLWQHEGGKLLWSLHKNDVLEVTIDEDVKRDLKLPVPAGKVLCVVQKFSNSKLQVNLLHDARPLQEKDGQARWVSGGCGLRTFTKAQARKVDLTPFGKVNHKHRKLWHGTKTD